MIKVIYLQVFRSRPRASAAPTLSHLRWRASARLGSDPSGWPARFSALFPAEASRSRCLHGPPPDGRPPGLECFGWPIVFHTVNPLDMHHQAAVLVNEVLSFLTIDGTAHYFHGTLPIGCHAAGAPCAVASTNSPPSAQPPRPSWRAPVEFQLISADMSGFFRHG